MPVRLAAKSVKKIAKLAELEGVDRSTVLRMLIDIGLDSPRVSLLMRPPRVKGSTAVQRVIRVMAAERQVRATQSALLRAPSNSCPINVYGQAWTTAHKRRPGSSETPIARNTGGLRFR